MKRTDSSLNEALIKSYVARAKLFYSVLKSKNIEKLFTRVEKCAIKDITWNIEKLGISKEAFIVTKTASIPPYMIFCHPEILNKCPNLVEYYRSLTALSQKGLSQILSGRLPKARKGDNKERFQLIAETLNKVISSVIIDTEGFSFSLAKNALIAEIGSEIQGTWVNIIGQGAAKAVEEIIQEYAQEKEFVSSTEKKDITVKGKKQKQIHLILNNNWRIIFSSEPDISIRDNRDKLKVAIEIKGSMDKAGAQTRLGEAKKSFAKAKSENAHCLTIYLASCFTEAVLSQLKTDREIDTYFNLIDILADEKKKQEFLEELFHYQIRIE
ncbi:MAG: XcyI family restriction endonuclease [Nitrospirae bacterium]|nr:XcyI family restriction endonuclease [Nitrospirota bacterium]